MQISELNHITLAVKDVNVSFDFYHKTLQFKPLVKWHLGAYFLVGDLWFCIIQDQNITVEKGYTHYAFSVDKDKFEDTKQYLIGAGCRPFKENKSPGDSFYFLDPDGHQLEIHSEDWKSRIESKKKHLGSWQNVEWFA